MKSSSAVISVTENSTVDEFCYGIFHHFLWNVNEMFMDIEMFIVDEKFIYDNFYNGKFHRT